MLVASTFNLYDGTDPARRYGKASGSFSDEAGEAVDRWRMRWGLCARARCYGYWGHDQEHINCATATMTRAMGRSEWGHAIVFTCLGIRTFRCKPGERRLVFGRGR